nr:PAAR domain-containing protein [Pseudomonas sp. URMO17WK12:I11]
MTTTGAICIATGEDYLDKGRMVLRLGDPTTPCPLCGLEGKVVEGVWHFISDGQPVAMDGALVDCGCPEGSNRVVAPLGEMPPPRLPVAVRISVEPAGPGSSSFSRGLARQGWRIAWANAAGILCGAPEHVVPADSVGAG